MQDAAAALVFDSLGRVLLVQRAKEPLRGAWSVPGGRCEPGELPEQAALRELYEETGLTATRASVLCVVELGGYRIHECIIHEPRGTPVAGDDAQALCWASRADEQRLALTPALRQVLLQAREEIEKADKAT